MGKIEIGYFASGGEVRVSGDTYELREKLKSHGYSWNPTTKAWYKSVLSLQEIESEIQFLKGIAEATISDEMRVAKKIAEVFGILSGYDIYENSEGKVYEIVFTVESDENVEKLKEIARKIKELLEIDVMIEKVENESTKNIYDTQFD